MTRPIDLYWSFRSPYCYLSMARLFALPEEMDVSITLRHVWPGAMRRQGYFDRLHPNYMTYNGLDSPRTAAYLGIPYARPVPDPLVFDPVTREPIADQPYIRNLTRLALAARELGHGNAFLQALMSLLWDGEIQGWDTGDHIEKRATGIGLDYAQLMQLANDKSEAFDAEVDANGKLLDAAGHWGVPCMVFKGEPFFGQDRVDMLIWRIRQSETPMRGD